MEKLIEELLKVEEDRNLGKYGYSIEETDKILSDIIEKTLYKKIWDGRQDYNWLLKWELEICTNSHYF